MRWNTLDFESNILSKRHRLCHVELTSVVYLSLHHKLWKMDILYHETMLALKKCVFRLLHTPFYQRKLNFKTTLTPSLSRKQTAQPRKAEVGRLNFFLVSTTFWAFNFYLPSPTVPQFPTCCKKCCSWRHSSIFFPSPSFGSPITYWTTGWNEWVHKP